MRNLFLRNFLGVSTLIDTPFDITQRNMLVRQNKK